MAVGAFDFWEKFISPKWKGLVAQSVDRAAVNRKVVGSNPTETES
jgi:hypothetical protein